jgi:hypothetical protein
MAWMKESEGIGKLVEAAWAKGGRKNGLPWSDSFAIRALCSDGGGRGSNWMRTTRGSEDKVGNSPAAV